MKTVWMGMDGCLLQSSLIHFRTNFIAVSKSVRQVLYVIHGTSYAPHCTWHSAPETVKLNE